MSEPTAGHWTTEPQTVPGWYWWIYIDSTIEECVCVEQDRSGRLMMFRAGWEEGMEVARCGGEWWTIPIQGPLK